MADQTVCSPPTFDSLILFVVTSSRANGNGLDQKGITTMQEELPSFSDEQLSKHEVVNQLIALCSTATRRWVQKEIDRDYLFRLSGLAGACLGLAGDYGLEGHRSNDERMRTEAKVLVSKLTEVRELLRYSRYAAASLVAEPNLVDTPESRQKLIDRHEATEPGFGSPSP